MNLIDMMKLAERGHEFIAYMNDFYSLEHDGIYAEEFQFEHEEIVEGINEYLKSEQVRKDIMKYGADTVDREAVRDIILTMRGEA
jgi:hypothetical protein